ncbi:MAG TPA: BrnA antitoxin family protein [Candidatus Saccharimonadales bacterium]|jgi:predicted DNA binding CopG/RHH family protein
MGKIRPIPKFKSEDEEIEFWYTHDSTDYIDWSKAEQVVFTNLKPSTRSISLRLSVSLLSNLKVLANKRGIPYKSLIEIYLVERVYKEFSKKVKYQH